LILLDHEEEGGGVVEGLLLVRSAEGTYVVLTGHAAVGLL